jgi:hypothetical protein
MPYVPLTESGKKFIRKICEGKSNNLIQGVSLYNKKPVGLPFSTEENNPKIWVSNAVDVRNHKILTNEQLGEALIDWFDIYCIMYRLDSNIIAAQAYQESKYNIWIYNANLSAASGISQFVMSTTYEIMIKPGGYSSVIAFTDAEKAKITKNLNGDVNSSLSYLLGGDITTKTSRQLAHDNRAILHQNIIDNPDLCIKAQCRLMKYNANLSNNLASSTLFCYSRGNFQRQTYTDTIAAAKSSKGDGYIVEGLDYVKKIFGYLGDEHNKYIANLPKPKGYWFGYDQLKLGDKFNDFSAANKESINKFG